MRSKYEIKKNIPLKDIFYHQVLCKAKYIKII